MELGGIVEEILAFMEAEPENQYRVTVGTDSELAFDGHADFVNAIVVHRVGRGGRYFWRRTNIGPFFTLRDRIIREVMMSLELGQELISEFEARNMRAADFNFAIHADVGENGPTKAIIQEVVGMIKAYNFEAITKPESYAASNVADRHV